MRLKTKLMHRDILIRLNSINKPQRYLTEKLGISRSTLWRLNLEKDITVETFLKLVQWLERSPERYIEISRGKYTQIHLQNK